MSTDRLIRAHRATTRWRDRLWTAFTACFDGVWLGLLDHRRLARFDEDVYDEGTDVHEGRLISYSDRAYNLAGMHSWEAAAVAANFAPGSRVVVTSAGAGREVIALLQQGFDAVGYEPNRTLVATGSGLLAELEHGERLQACERDAFPAAVARCDGIVVGWGGYSLICGRARRVAFLRAARHALAPGAPILCSFLMRSPDTRYYAIVARTSRLVRGMRRAERPELGDTMRRHYIHFFTREEIELELRAAGFRPVAFSSVPYGHVVALAD